MPTAPTGLASSIHEKGTRASSYLTLKTVSYKERGDIVNSHQVGVSRCLIQVPRHVVGNQNRKRPGSVFQTTQTPTEDNFLGKVF